MSDSNTNNTNADGAPMNALWPVYAPFVQIRRAVDDDIDAFGHVNNLRYLAWAMDVAWAHSSALGLTFQDYQRIGVGCVVWRHEFDYVAPVRLGDVVHCATWVASSDRRLRLVRGFQMRRDQTLILRGQTTFVTIDMKSGKPARMPEAFQTAYVPAEPQLHE